MHNWRDQLVFFFHLATDVKTTFKEWTGLEWNIIVPKAETRKEWRKLDVKSTMVPQRSARLRDRYSNRGKS